MTESNPTLETPVRPRRSALRRILRGGAILGVVLVAIVLALPAILSMDWARTRVERGLSEALGTEVRIADYGLGWFSGLEVEGVTVENPKGFPRDERLFQMRSLRGDASIVSLVRGRFELSGVIDGLELRVRQRSDGTTNVGELVGVGKTVRVEGRTPRGGGKTEVDIADFRFDLEVRDAFIEVLHEEKGVLERLQNVHARISKEFGTQVAKVEFAADLHRPGSEQTGRLELELDAQADQSAPIDARLNCLGLDLSRYRPVLATFLADDRLTAFAGVLTANARVTGVPTEELRIEGTVAVDEPHFAGPLLQGMDLRAPRWTLRPNATARMGKDGAAPRLDLSNVEADLGFVKLRGLPRAAGDTTTEVLALGFDLDVATLAEAGGPIPPLLRGSATTVKGELRVPMVEDFAALKPADLLAAVVLDAAVAVGELRVASQTLQELRADVGLDGGKLVVSTTAGRLNGGGLSLRVEADATNLDQPPITVALGVDGAAVGSGALAALQYAVPLFAGLAAAAEKGAAVDFQSVADLTLEVSGPAFPAEGQSVLAWLDGWSGRGRLGLEEGSFRPADALAGLLQLTGESGKLSFRDLVTDFTIRQGFVETGLMRLEAKGRELGIQGRTSLAGAIDYSIDLRPLLAGHSDGAKILEYLGDAPIGAKLAGTLAAPSLAMPDLGRLAQDALRSTLEKEARERIEKEAGNLLEKVLGGKKKDGEEPGAGTPEDAARKALEGILRGVIPPPKPPAERKRDGSF